VFREPIARIRLSGASGIVRQIHTNEPIIAFENVVMPRARKLEPIATPDHHGPWVTTDPYNGTRYIHCRNQDFRTVLVEQHIENGVTVLWDSAGRLMGFRVQKEDK
jgi:hypothetical protein